MAQNSIITVRICHSDPLVMAGLAALLGREPDFDVFQAASDVRPINTDVVVADYGCAMALLAAAPTMSASSEANRDPDASQGNHARPRIVVMTRRDKEGEIAQAIHRGVRGYLLQSADPLELVDAVRHVARGGSHYLCKRAADRFESEDLAFFDRVRAGYAARMAADPGRFVRVDSSLERDAVWAQIDAELERRGW